ncbi:MAG: hypothetical protein ABIP34_17275 [Rhodoferax sp.]|uniref:hypothetical protein n=1 Tax=Rhodoferax sp. TaxID=50421 RepID=UPI0032632352
MGFALQKMTLAEFMAWEDAQTERHEFYRGEVFAMVGGTARHNRVILWWSRCLRGAFKAVIAQGAGSYGTRSPSESKRLINRVFQPCNFSILWKNYTDNGP